MKFEKPLVTIGMPVYNGAKIVGDAINTALKQSFENFRLLISDNASTDETDRVCRDFAAKDTRIEYFRQAQNIGPVANFNFVKESCKTDFFVWLACDDRWHPDFLKLSIEKMQQNPECSLVFSDFRVMNLENNELDPQLVKIMPDQSPFPGHRILTRILDMKPSLVYGLQRQCFLHDLRLELFDFSDVFFSFQAALRGTLEILPEPLYIAGVKGRRIAYSLTGKEVCRTTFLKKSTALFFRNLRAVESPILTVILAFMLLRHKIVFAIRQFMAGRR